MVNLLHARIQAAHHPFAATGQRHCLEGADAQQRNIRRKGQPLCHRAGDAQTGKRTRTLAVGNAVEIGQPHTAIGQHAIHHANQDFRVGLSGTHGSRMHVPASRQGDAAILR
jgi:hypothetical protein